MLIYFLSYLTVFLLGIFVGIKANKWSNKINLEINHKKSIKASNEIFEEIIGNLNDKKVKFVNRINNQVYLRTKIKNLGKVEILYLIDKPEIALFQNHICILTTENIQESTINKIVSSINSNFENQINDIINIFGLIFHKRTFEKTFNMNVEELRNKNLDLQQNEKNEVEKIIENNRTKFDIDEILDKINKEGIQNLTDEERRFLDNYNN